MAALEAVKGAVADKGFVPILQHVLISGDSLLGYDSEIGIRHKLNTKFPTPFNVRADTLLNLLKNLEAEELDIEVEDKKIHIACGSHKSTLTQITEEFPKPNVAIKSSDWREVPAGFKEALERCLSAVSEDENNRALSAVFVAGDKVYGADGQRAVRCAVEGMDLKPFLLPRNAVQELAKLGNPKRMVVAGGGGGNSIAFFDFLNLVFLARLRDGTEYPQKMYDTLFESRTTEQAVPQGLGGAMARLSLFVDKENPKVRVEAKPLGMELSARGGTSSAEEVLAPWEGPEFALKGVNPAYVMDALVYAESMDWGARLQDPLYFTGEASGFECLIAPMKAD